MRGDTVPVQHAHDHKTNREHPANDLQGHWRGVAVTEASFWTNRETLTHPVQEYAKFSR